MGLFDKLFGKDEKKPAAPTEPAAPAQPGAPAQPAGTPAQPHAHAHAAGTTCAAAAVPVVAAAPNAPPKEVLQLPIAHLANIDHAHPESWNIVHKGFGKHNENSTVENLPDGAACAVHYPAGSINPTAKDRPVGGIGFYASPAILPGHDVELSYSLAFDATFQPQKGGKLPGLFLCHGDCADVHGGSGGRHSEHHASLRLMWRKEMQAEAYVYATAAHDVPAYKAIPHSHYNPEYGDSLWRGEMKFHKQGWNTVRLRVRLNNVGKADGWLFVEVNGVAREFKGMMWRHVADVEVSALFMSTFYGGSKPDYACPCDTTIRFKDFVLKKWS